jgi:hypothetical protein
MGGSDEWIGLMRHETVGDDTPPPPSSASISLQSNPSEFPQTLDSESMTLNILSLTRKISMI